MSTLQDEVPTVRSARLAGLKACTTTVVALAMTTTVATLSAQDLAIGTIDLFGLKTVPAADVRRALTFKEGDTLNAGGRRPAVMVDSERQVGALPGVERARINVVCCEQGKLVVYVGVEERNAPSTVRFLAPPAGAVRLAADVLDAEKAFETAFGGAIQRGDFAEDDSRGHAFFHDPATRAVQERFVALAERDRERLREVLRDAADAEQRALAAQLLGYVTDKQGVVDDLVRAMRDPDETVRNNAMRALMVFTKMTTGPAPRVPYEPFVQMLNSPVWTDRNKSSIALEQLSARRDPELLRTLREAAFDSLAEMARWKAKGHALSAFTILGRIAALQEPAILQAWERDDRQAVIDAATKSR